MSLDDILRDLEFELGGFGPATIDAIDETFETEDEFETAVRRAYDDRDTDALQEVSGLGHGYALKLARWYADRDGWSGGAAEPQEVQVMSGDEFVDMLDDQFSQ